MNYCDIFVNLGPQFDNVSDENLRTPVIPFHDTPEHCGEACINAASGRRKSKQKEEYRHVRIKATAVEVLERAAVEEGFIRRSGHPDLIKYLNSFSSRRGAAPVGLTKSFTD
eukprot:753992-Hanusia_phi.AAC.1